MIMKYALLSFTLLLCSILPATKWTDQSIEYGKVVFKVASDSKQALTVNGARTGLESLDRILDKLQVTKVNHHFKFNPKYQRQDLPDLSLIYELSFDPDMDPNFVIGLLLRDPNVQYAEPVYIDKTFENPNDPGFETSLFFNSLNATDAWAIHKGENGSQPVIVAIVDTGVNWKHPDIAENIWQNVGEDANGNGYTMYHNGSAWVMDPGDLNGIDDDGNGFTDDLIGWNFMLDAIGNQNNNPIDPGTHGTAVAGISGARTNNGIGTSSLSWNIVLMPISCAHPGQTSTVYRGYNAIIYAAENGADIINCSWGGTASSQINQDAVNYAYGLGSIIIAAGGNSNNSTPIYPAAYQNVIAVAALQNSGVKASSSNFGAYIDVGAPTGTMYTTSSSSYTTVSHATSYASPVASALAALIKSYNPTWTREQVINQLIATCDNVDLLNPSYVKRLGQGKLNAFRALNEVNPIPIQELKLAIHQVGTPNDENGNLAIETGEEFSLNLILRNYTHGASAQNATFVLSSTDPMVTVFQNTHLADIPADGFVHLEDAFLIRVSESAVSKYVTFMLTSSADIPVVIGNSLTFTILINAGGILVWEGKSSARNMSGAYIRDRLISMGKSVVYGTSFPASFLTFDAVFLSFGMVGSDIIRFADPKMYFALKDYLLSGGKVYIEGCDVVGYDMAYYLPDIEDNHDAHEILWPLLGISSASDGSTRAIQYLSSENGWHTSPLLFLSSTQTTNQYIDTFVPNQNSVVSFVEGEYGAVAIENIGFYGQRSFVFSYALRELVDSNSPNTRYELLDRIIDFFERDSFILPNINELSIAYIDDDNVQISWSYPFDVDRFVIYHDFAPYGQFDSVLSTTIAPQHLIPSSEWDKSFFRIKAERQFGIDLNR